MKKLIYMIAFALIFVNSQYVYASNVESEKREYVIDEIGDYLSGLEYNSKSEIMLSQKFDVEEAENEMDIYFVKVDGKTIGAITLSEDKSNNSSAFLYSESAFSKLKSGEETSVNLDENGISVIANKQDVFTGEENYSDDLIQTSNKIKFSDISKDVKLNKNQMNKVLIENDQNEAIECQEYEDNYTTGFVKVGSYQRTYDQVINSKNKKYLYCIPLSFRKNYSIKNRGICWAAAGTSIINYKRGGTNFTTMKTYNWLKEKYNDTPCGTLLWINRMWDYYSISMKYVNHKLSFDTVKTKLKNNKPIFCCFDHYEGKNAKVEYAHAVALCGCFYRKDQKKYYYVYMDPNWASQKVYVVNHIPQKVLNGEKSKFYYNPGDGKTIYNNWRYAYY